MTQMQRLEQRGREAVARCLIKELTVPNIYFDAAWPSSEEHVDLLAIDRAGAGDLHVVEIKGPLFNWEKLVERLMSVPAQYRWVASVGGRRGSRSKRADAAPQVLYPTDRMGRIGVIEVCQTAGDELQAQIKFRAERFPGNLADEVDRFILAHKPDIEFR
jgi:hypothetical protein